jgi:ubiquinone/menaquinone biosynthesis C-methylase UbiE
VSRDSATRVEDEIETRVRLYDYSTGKQTFFQWQAGMLPSMDEKSILELGAGNGALWKDLLPRCRKCRIHLTDIAEDVLDSARETLTPVESMTESLTFEPVDFNNLPFPDQSFDVVIANHNLFYAQDVSSVLKSIHRILTPGGVLICSTIGQDHLHELVDIIRQHKADLPWGAEKWADRFGLENGAQLLLSEFQHVDQFEYDNNLHVNAIDPVISYLKKTMKGALTQWITKNRDDVESILHESMHKKGYIRLSPHSGFFIAYKAE